jgi:pyridoxamine 5'-phosphate oxidase
VLENIFEKNSQEYSGGIISRPSYWGGYIVKPELVEFWQGRPNRLHDRLQYTMNNEGSWIIERLAP